MNSLVSNVAATLQLGEFIEVDSISTATDTFAYTPLQNNGISLGNIITETTYFLDSYDFVYSSWCSTNYVAPTITEFSEPSITYPDDFFCGFDYGSGVRTATFNPPVITNPECDYNDWISWTTISVYNDETVMQYIKVHLNPETNVITVEAKAGARTALGHQWQNEGLATNTVATMQPCSTFANTSNRHESGS